MDHGELVRRITMRAEARALLWHACGRALRCTGQQGLPDLIVAGPGGIAFIEAKTGGQLDDGQLGWRHMIQASGTSWLRADPADLWNGTIDRELDRLAGH